MAEIMKKISTWSDTVDFPQMKEIEFLTKRAYLVDLIKAEAVVTIRDFFDPKVKRRTYELFSKSVTSFIEKCIINKYEIPLEFDKRIENSTRVCLHRFLAILERQLRQKEVFEKNEEPVVVPIVKQILEPVEEKCCAVEKEFIITVCDNKECDTHPLYRSFITSH